MVNVSESLLNVVSGNQAKVADNVNHAKLIRQIWAMGIHDKQLIFVIRRILKAPIKLEDGTFITPDKGTPSHPIGSSCG